MKSFAVISVLLITSASVAIAAPGSTTSKASITSKSCVNRAQTLADDDYLRCYHFRTEEYQVLSAAQLKGRRDFCKSEADERKSAEIALCKVKKRRKT